MRRPRSLRAGLAAWIAVAVMTAGVFHAGSAAVVFLVHEEREAEAGLVGAPAENRVVAIELVAAMALIAALVAAGAAGAGLWLAGKALAPMRQAAEHTRRAAHAGAGDVLLPLRGVEEWDGLASAVNEVLRLQQRTIERARTFSANAAHELRTPLAAILGEVQVTLRRERSPEEYRAALSGVEAEVIRLGEGVEALLMLSRSDSGELRVRAGTFDVGAVASEAARVPKVRDRGPTLVLPPSSALARGDARLTRRVLDNLIDNARRHGGREVEVRVAPGDDVVSVSVTDDGPGLPPTVRARLFERFNREQGGPDGHGLGLAIAHALTAAQGGALRLEEVPGRTRFVMELPRAGR